MLKERGSRRSRYQRQRGSGAVSRAAAINNNGVSSNTHTGVSTPRGAIAVLCQVHSPICLVRSISEFRVHCTKNASKSIPCPSSGPKRESSLPTSLMYFFFGPDDANFGALMRLRERRRLRVYMYMCVQIFSRLMYTCGWACIYVHLKVDVDVEVSSSLLSSLFLLMLMFGVSEFLSEHSNGCGVDYSEEEYNPFDVYAPSGKQCPVDESRTDWNC